MSDIAIYHHGEFADLGELVRLKRAQGLSVSLCVPVLNEEDTIGDVVRCLKGALLDETPLLDEVAVMDSGSTDRTREVAAAAGAEVHLASEILPECGPARGKGENIWKATARLKGDIICFVDGDVRNMHPRFVYGPLGVLLKQTGVAYAKGFYDRPHAAVELGVRPAGGGRVTEALVRPLFSLFYPELAGFVQPLAGEYAARRSILEQIPMPTGYGIETALLLDIYRLHGAAGLAQCDLDERIHRHQDTASLGRMSFAILQAFLRRTGEDGVLTAPGLLPDLYRSFVRADGVMQMSEVRMEDIERPPLQDVPGYVKR